MVGETKITSAITTPVLQADRLQVHLPSTTKHQSGHRSRCMPRSCFRGARLHTRISSNQCATMRKSIALPGMSLPSPINKNKHAQISSNQRAPLILKRASSTSRATVIFSYPFCRKCRQLTHDTCPPSSKIVSTLWPFSRRGRIFYSHDPRRPIPASR